jgi:membrane-associated phospholipid phosphatase
MNSNTRLILANIVAGAAITLAGLVGIDRIVAEYLRNSGYQALPLFIDGTVLFDTVTGKDISKFLIGLVITGAGLALLAKVKARTAAFGLLFVGAVQLLATLVAGVTKNLFGRLRPFELLKSGDWSNEWFVDGSSFPSGHAGFYFGLFLPLVFVFPRWRWPLLIVPWFIAIARVNANHHFVSDVGASIMIAGALTLWLARLLRHRLPSASLAPR